MKTIIRVGIVAAVWILWPPFAAAVSPTPAEMAQARGWMAARFEDVPEAKTVEPFFSFTYDGKSSAELLKTWELKRSSEKLDNVRTRHTLAYTDPKTGLELRCVGVEYSDYPSVEWTLYFKNTGDKDTPILSDIQSLDLRVKRQPNAGARAGDFLLHHNTGSKSRPNDFEPRETLLYPGTKLVLAGEDGRPTGDHLSYYNLELSPREGIIIAVGWPGQLATRLNRDKADGLRIRSGQELTHFKLLPGEEACSPLIVLQFWKGGDWLCAQNVWRRWFIAHNLPRPGGKLPPVQWSGGPVVAENIDGAMELVTEENSKKCVDAYEAMGLKPDFWWMDAGWYSCGGKWYNTGTWEFDKKRFPNGLRPVSDYLHARGIRSLLWFEPERVTPKTWLADNHPEWLLGEGSGARGNRLLNLGNPNAWNWLLETIDRLVTESDLDIYRQDFNMAPLAHWRANDAEDRRGITEIRYVTGLLAFWDELLRRHPNLLYDNCASGGRRNDLETLRRGVPFSKSDYAYEPVGVQGETYGISLWLPYYAATWMWDEDAYSCRSRMALVTGALLKPNDKNHGKQLPKRLDEWRKTVPNYWGDFWPLTPYSLDSRVWIAWQFDRPEEGQGVVQAFRRAESDFEAARFRLRGLDPDAAYTLTNLDVEGSTEMTGRELLEKGLPVAIKDRPSAVIITYKKKSQ